MQILSSYKSVRLMSYLKGGSEKESIFMNYTCITLKYRDKTVYLL